MKWDTIVIYESTDFWLTFSILCFVALLDKFPLVFNCYLLTSQLTVSSSVELHDFTRILICIFYISLVLLETNKRIELNIAARITGYYYELWYLQNSQNIISNKTTWYTWLFSKCINRTRKIYTIINSIFRMVSYYGWLFVLIHVLLRIRGMLGTSNKRF